MQKQQQQKTHLHQKAYSNDSKDPYSHYTVIKRETNKQTNSVTV